MKLYVCIFVFVCAALAQFVPTNPVAPPPAPAVVVSPVLSPDAAVAKYEKCFVGQNQEIFQTINEADQIVAKLRSEGFVIKGVYCQPTAMGATVVYSIPVAQMLKDGFPRDKKFNVVIEGESNWHNAEQVGRWLKSGLWGWGLKYLLLFYW